MISYTHEMQVDVVGQYGTDLDICRAAWVSTGADPETPSEARQRGVIGALMRDKHGTPFEAGYLAVRINAPRAVRDEHVRHRSGSYSSASLRYRGADLLGEIDFSAPTPPDEAVFYIPGPRRPLMPVDGTKPIRPRYQILSVEQHREYVDTLLQGLEAVARTYRKAWDLCPSTEAVRWITPDCLMTPYHARFNPRQAMTFLELRTNHPHANHTSHPMWEIEWVARRIEERFAERWPLTYAAWQENGREAP